MRRRVSVISRLVVFVVTITFASVGVGQLTGASVPTAIVLNGGTAPIPAGDALVGQAPSSKTLSIEVALQPRDPAALTAEVDAVSTPGSPQYHQFLAPGQFAQFYGPTPSTVSAVTSALQNEGLAVGQISGSGLSLPVTGSVAQVEAAFDTPITAYRQLSGQIGYDNVHSPSVPATIAPHRRHRRT
jgi:subtilase family serine protease